MEDVGALLATSGLELLPEKNVDGKTPRDLAESDELRQCLGKS